MEFEVTYLLNNAHICFPCAHFHENVTREFGQAQDWRFAAVGLPTNRASLHTVPDCELECYTFLFSTGVASVLAADALTGQCQASASPHSALECPVHAQCRESICTAVPSAIFWGRRRSKFMVKEGQNCMKVRLSIRFGFKNGSRLTLE